MSLSCAWRKLYFFHQFLMFLIVFDHAKACASMCLLVEIHNIHTQLNHSSLSKPTSKTNCMHAIAKDACFFHLRRTFFLTTLYGLYFSHYLHILKIIIFHMLDLCGQLSCTAYKPVFLTCGYLSEGFFLGIFLGLNF